MQAVTELLMEWEKGDRAALDKLVPIVYEELRRIAGRYLRRERREHTLQTTALVNEAYLRLVDQRKVQWKSRAHFFAIAAQMMRRILIDYARKRHRSLGGEPAQMIPLDDAFLVSSERCADAILLDEALTKLKTLDPRKSQIAELRIFGGLTAEEVAEALQVSAVTVNRDWLMAKAWISRELLGAQHNGSGKLAKD